MIEMGARKPATYKLRRCHIPSVLYSTVTIFNQILISIPVAKKIEQFEIVTYL